MATAGFLWVEDPEVRELLRSRRQTADLFVDPSPPAGLLVQAGVELERLARRCRSLGVELIVGGTPYRTRSVPPGKAGSGSGPRRLDSSNTLPSLRAARAPSSARQAAQRVPSSARQPAARTSTSESGARIDIIDGPEGKRGAGE